MKFVIALICLVGTLARLPEVYSCADRSSASDCEGWKAAGFCTQHASLKYWCEKTCGFCGGPPTPAPPATPAPPSQAPGSCGRRPNTRIVGGSEAPKHSWPWQAQLRYPDGFPFCGGSLVTPEWIVTAAHCVPGRKPGDIKIRLGAHFRLTSSIGTEQDFDVVKIISHPSYQSPKRYSHDIALVKLAKPAILSKFVGTVCLPEDSIRLPLDDNSKQCWISGWGRLASGGASPNVLMQASVPLVSRSRCDVGYPGKIHDSMLCAGLDIGGVDACQGDSGGPLVCESQGKWYLEGATSWGYGCAAPMRYGVYAKVRYLNTWLKNTMASN